MKYFKYLLNLLFIMLFFNACTTKLMDASKKNDLSTVQKEIRAGVDINKEGPDNTTALYFAAIHGNLEVVKILVKNGANLNHRPKFYTPIEAAILKGYYDIAKFMIENGTNINITPTKGDTTPIMALIDAKWHDNKYHYNYSDSDLDMAHYLVKHGAKLSDLNLYDNAWYKEMTAAKNNFLSQYNNYVNRLAIEEKEKLHILEETNKENKIQMYETNNDFIGLKNYINKHPNSLKYIKNSKNKLLLTGYGNRRIDDIISMINNYNNENQIIYELDITNISYLPYFSQEQKNYLMKKGFSSRLIEFLELHTQEVILKKKEQERIAYLEKKREEKRERTQKAIRQKNMAKQKKQDSDMWGKMAAIGMGAVIANSSSLGSKAKGEFLSNYSQDVMNNDITMKNTEKWKDETIKSNINNNQQYTKKRNNNDDNSYLNDKKYINNNYNNKLAEIHAKKTKLLSQKKEIKPKKSGKVYKTYTDVVEDSFSSHDKKSALLNVTAGLRVKANEFCRERGWEYSDARDRKPYIIGCKEINNEVKCDARIKFGCYKYEY